jgi:hypothetical protein
MGILFPCIGLTYTGKDSRGTSEKSKHRLNINDYLAVDCFENGLYRKIIPMLVEQQAMSILQFYFSAKLT